ncbi:hypothetical protein Q7P37_005829 [Cladosporium fusiforme]
MRSNAIVIAASLAALIQAQDLGTVLAGQPTLSTLNDLLGQVSNTTEFLASQENVTLFAPSDDALAAILAQGGIFSIDEASVDPGLIEQILRYHLFRGVVKAEDITEVPQFVSSYLNYSGIVLDGEVSGSNVTGGQVVSISLDEDGNAIVTSGLKSTSQVVAADIEFDNGVVHIIDKLLIIPLSVSQTFISGNFTALAGAATQVDLVGPLEDLSDVTIFAPNNDAFQKIASAAGNITDEQLAEILQYHVIQGTVGYSTSLSNTSLTTLAGEDIRITISAEGAVFVNNARVINSDVLIENGVLHVIDEVLNPANADAEPSENSNNAATSVASFVPFTFGVQPETSIFSEMAQTTSLVAAALVTGASGASGATGNGSATTSGAPVEQTANAGVSNSAPVMAAVGVVMGAVAFAM